LMEENNVETSSKFVTKGLKSVEYLQHTRWPQVDVLGGEVPYKM
jgi:hypothetical protein